MHFKLLILYKWICHKFSTLGKSHTHTHTHCFNDHFSREPGLAGCPLNWERTKLSMSFLTQSHHVLFGHPLRLIPSTSHIIQRLTQSLSYFRSRCPNRLNLLFLIIKLTGSNPKSFLSFFTSLYTRNELNLTASSFASINTG